jgi:DNA polymerase-3 subunit epsilon
MITNEDYIEWGKQLYEKAKIIHKYEIAHKIKVIDILESIVAKYNISDDELDWLYKIEFESYLINERRSGHEEVKFYWLNYILDYPYSVQHRVWDESIRKILENKTPHFIFDTFNKKDFDENGNFILLPNYKSKKSSIRVPYSLDLYQIEFAIKLIEYNTNSKVDKISLWYRTDDKFITDMNIHQRVYIAIDDKIIDNHYESPLISKEEFLNIKFTSKHDWYKEISQFKNYIQKIDIETRANYPSCQLCSKSDDVTYDDVYGGINYYYCSSCKVDFTDEYDDNQTLFYLPKCINCNENINVVDRLDYDLWCSECNHDIDLQGNCISEHCETCSKGFFDSENGPYYLFFDTETTGVPKNWKAPITNFENWPRIIQLAWIVADSNGNEIYKNNFIIKPDGFTIPIEASNVHGITTEYAIRVGNSLENVLKIFEKYCSNSEYLIAHNISFDSKVIGSEFLRILSRNPLENHELLCTMESSTNYCKISGNYGYKWPKLSELHIKLFGIDFEGAHNALSDIEATAKCFWEMRKLKLI